MNFMFDCMILFKSENCVLIEQGVITKLVSNTFDIKDFVQKAENKVCPCGK